MTRGEIPPFLLNKSQFFKAVDRCPILSQTGIKEYETTHVLNQIVFLGLCNGKKMERESTKLTVHTLKCGEQRSVTIYIGSIRRQPVCFAFQV